MKIEVIKGSVVDADADAIVNAANENLLMGGGVCGAIFQAAGIKELQEACRKLGHCDTGAAVITPAFNLKSKYIIHAVGPIYTAKTIDADLLSSAYGCSLFLADIHNCKSIAFCCISTGIYGYPLQEAAVIAVREVLEYVPKKIEKVQFYCYTDREYEVYSRLVDFVNKQLGV